MLAWKATTWMARLIPFLLPLTCQAAELADNHRVVVYYQTTNTNDSDTSHISLLPLINSAATISVTHVLVAAVHIVDDDGGIRLNDFPPDNERFDQVWSDTAALQAKGVTVMAMVGGAAAGTWTRLDGDDDQFERYYGPLHDMIGSYNLQGLDLDVEQSMSLGGIVRLIDRLKADFGDDFVITLAPVGSALTEGGANLSGFDYFDLEAQRGAQIAFYNGQFYSGFASAASARDYEAALDDGFPAARVVLGLLTSPANGNGFVDLDAQAPVLEELARESPGFGGVAAWEYFNSLPGGEAAPWEWAAWMADHMAEAAAKEKQETSTREALWRSVRKAGRRVRREARKVYRDYIA
ncbi:glycoside hydrolase superfamily [Biscogniauxia mediterranea]|nr:glycoside hydrolase superfamily [Biscogniauxia mediterranea]